MNVRRVLGGCNPACVAAAVAVALGGLAFGGPGQAAVRSLLTLTAPSGYRVAHGRPGAPRPGHLGRVRFYSRALHRWSDYLVYLPRAYPSAHRLPVFYGLHGMPGHPLAFTANAAIEPRLEWLVRRHRIRPMILVFPDGRIGGRTRSDSEWADTPAGRFDSYVVDVVRDVDHRFRTVPRRADRVIAGLSAGAYGAANVGLHHLGLFGGIQVWSGYFRETHDGVFAGAAAATMIANSPLDYVSRLRPALVRHPAHVFIYTGTRDRDRWQTPPMTAALRAAGADAAYAVYPGGHGWRLWSAHLDQMLELASRWIQDPAPWAEGTAQALSTKPAPRRVRINGGSPSLRRSRVT